jgi:hypothetical protein
MSLVDQSYLGETNIRYLKLIKFNVTGRKSKQSAAELFTCGFSSKISSLCICQREI